MSLQYLPYLRHSLSKDYLGDTLWEPLENKVGDWRMTLELDERIIADKTFVVEEDLPYEGAQFWQRSKLRLVASRQYLTATQQSA